MQLNVTWSSVLLILLLAVLDLLQHQFLLLPPGVAFSSAGSSSCGLQEGMKIEHQRFGRGTVLKIEGTGRIPKATVEFVHSGTKQLLLKYAKFTVVD